MTLPPSRIRFLLLNNLTEPEVKRAEYVVYAHKCKEGIYVGKSNDPVKRWHEHYSNAFNKDYRNYDDKFRKAIRCWKHSFEHYILATAKFEKPAEKKEAFCISFYNAKLNMKNESMDISRDYGFKAIEEQIAKPCVLEKRKNRNQGFARVESDRVSVTGLVYKNQGRKRLKTIKDQILREDYFNKLKKIIPDVVYYAEIIQRSRS